MSMRRQLSWTAALAAMRDDRATRSEIREERLRTNRYASGAIALSVWRGMSGRRYVVSIHPADATDLPDGVVLYVRRDVAGVASLVAGGGGATEIHVHRLAVTAADRAAVTADLMLDRVVAEAA